MYILILIDLYTTLLSNDLVKLNSDNDAQISCVYKVGIYTYTSFNTNTLKNITGNRVFIQIYNIYVDSRHTLITVVVGTLRVYSYIYIYIVNKIY